MQILLSSPDSDTQLPTLMLGVRLVRGLPPLLIACLFAVRAGALSSGREVEWPAFKTRATGLSQTLPHPLADARLRNARPMTVQETFCKHLKHRTLYRRPPHSCVDEQHL